MPIVPAGSTVLITGANGYVGMWVTRTLLDDGYAVRGVVRSAEKGNHMTSHFASYGAKFDFVVVPDMMKEGAYDEVVLGVDAIVHAASPAHFPAGTGGDPDDYIVPAMQGTLQILQSAAKAGPQLKRFILTSSVSAVLTPPTKPWKQRTFDEGDWGDECVRIVGNLGSKASGTEAYNASKTLAEQTATEFYNSRKSELSWDMVALCPALALGRPLEEPKSVSDLNTSMLIWYRLVFSNQPDDFLKGSYSVVHIADMAKAHLLALRKENVGGQRMIISSGQITWQHTRDIINSIDPKYYASGKLPRGNPELDRTVTSIFKNEKSKELLGITYKEAEEIFADVVGLFDAHGWLSY